MGTTLANLLIKLNTEYIKIDPNNNIRSSSVKESFLNDGFLQIQKDGNFRRPDNVQYTSTTTVAGTDRYALPTDFQKLDLVNYNGTPLGKTSRETVLRSGSPISTGTPYKYYIYSNQIGFYPTPNTAGTADMVYFRRLPKMTSGVSSALNEDFDSAVCAWAAYKAFNSVEKQQKASMMFADYQSNLNMLLAKYMYDDMDLSFTLDRHTTTYRDNVLYD